MRETVNRCLKRGAPLGADWAVRKKRALCRAHPYALLTKGICWAVCCLIG